MSAVALAPTPAPDRGCDAEFARAPSTTAQRYARTALYAAVVAQPFVIPHGPGNSSLVDVFVLLAIGTCVLWVAVAGRRLRVPYAFGMGLLVFGGALAALLGSLPGTGLLTIGQDVVLLTFCAAVATVAREPGIIRTLAVVWARSSLVYACVFITGTSFGIVAVSGVVAREGNRAMFTFGDPNYAATYWVLSLFISFACATPRRRSLRLLQYGALIWSVVLTESNGAVVELTLGCVVLIALSIHRRYNTAAAVAVIGSIGVAIIGLLILFPFSSIQTAARDSGQPLLVNSLGRSNESSAQRSLLINESLQLFERSHYLGIGPAATKPLLQSEAFPYAKEAHDDYLASLTERGPVGLLGLVVLAGSVATRARPAFRAAAARRGRTPDLGIDRPAGLIAALVVVATAASYYEVLHFRFVWLLFGITAAIAALPGLRSRRVRS